MNLLPVWPTFKDSAELVRVHWQNLFRFTGPLALLLGFVQVIIPLTNSPLLALVLFLIAVAPLLWLHVQLFTQVIHIVEPAYDKKPGLHDPWRAAGRLLWTGIVACLGILGLFLLVTIPLISIAVIVFGSSLSSLAESLGTAGGLAGASIATMITLFVGTIFSTIITARLYLHWYFFSQETLVEGKRGIAALKSSTALVRGHAWKLFVWIFLTGLLTLIATIPGQIAARLLEWMNLPLAGAILAIIYATIFVTPLASFATTKLYVHMKEKRGNAANAS